MAGKSSLIDAVVAALGDDYAARMEPARQQLISEVQACLRDFPDILFEDARSDVGGDSIVPTYERRKWSTIRVFPLGDFCRVWLPPLTGYNSLYISDDRRLYEYGPARTHEPYDAESERITDNSIEMRQLYVSDLDFADLLVVRELLLRIWLA